MRYILCRMQYCLLLWCVPQVCLAENPVERIWDREPSLWELAKQQTVSQPIPPQDPQPVGTSFGGTAVGMSTKELKISLWGPPERLTLSLGKTDVWDRRCYQEPVLTIDQIRQIAQKGEKPPNNYYSGWRAYDTPCPKPVGQMILGCEDFAQDSRPTAVTSLQNGIRHVEMENHGSKVLIRYLPLMEQNVIAIQCDYAGLRNPVWVRLYRHQDTLLYGKSMMAYGGPDPKPYKGYDYTKDKNNHPLEAPAAGTDGSCFWIRQKLPDLSAGI